MMWVGVEGLIGNQGLSFRGGSRRGFPAAQPAIRAFALVG